MTSDPHSGADRALVEKLVPAIRAAGEAILAIRATGVTVEAKADASPVTAADRAGEKIVLAALDDHAPGIPAVAEEQVAAGIIPRVGSLFFLVDALDGTKEFIRGGDDFTVNIGLIRDGVPVAGLVAAPAKGLIWGGATGAGAFRVENVSGQDLIAPIAVRPPRTGGLDIVASRSHRNAETDAFIARYPGSRIVSAGSSLKFCVIAEGAADLYPRLGPTSQWDTAAGDAVLRAAGGKVLTLDGLPLSYGPKDGAGADSFLNPYFVATGGVDPID